MQGARPECAQIVRANRWTGDTASVKTNQMSSGLEPEFAISIHSLHVRTVANVIAELATGSEECFA